MTRRRIGMVMAALVLLVGLAACGSDDKDGKGGEAKATPSSGAAAKLDPTKTIRFAHYLGVDTWDPHQSLGGPNIPLLGLVYDSLVHVSPDGEAEPGLATSWTFDDMATSLTMKLRDGVTFSDGAAFDADVVKANIDRAMTNARSTSKSLLSSVSGVEVVDDMTVRFTLSKPNTALPLTLADRPGMMISPNLLGQEAITEPVGSGPFVVTASKLGQSASFERNDGYWDAKSVKVAGLEMTVMVDSTTRFNALVSGTIDVAQLDTTYVDQIKERGLTPVTGPDLRMFALELNPDVVPQFADERVRLAISLAVDRAAIVKGIFFGHGSALDQPFPPSSTAYDKDLEGALDRDVERAKELLADAGLADGFSFDIVIGTDPLQGQVAEAVQNQLRDVGIQLRIQKLDGFGPGQAYWTKHTVGAALFRITARYAHQSTIESWYTAGVQANPGNVTSPKVNELLATSFAQSDGDEVVSTMQEISKELVEHPLSVIPLVQEELVLAARSDVQGLRIWPAGFPVFTDVGVTR